MSGFLMAHFIGEQEHGEQVYFAVSRDGLHWKDLSPEPILRSTIGEAGVRDPFMIKCPQTGTYYLIATDLRIGAGKGWDTAQYRGSKDLIVWESKDLINWGHARSCRVAVDEAGCAWAPESIYDNTRQEFFVFWASMVKLDGDTAPQQRIYGSYTKDFTSFSEPFIYAEAENHVIDMNIIYENGWYYRFVKDESTKRVLMDKIKQLDDKNPIAIPVEALYDLVIEGPQTYQLPDGSWCLIVDQFGAGKGYLPLICKNLDSGDFKIVAEHEYDLGKLKKRHGSVIQISKDELTRLTNAFGAKTIS